MGTEKFPDWIFKKVIFYLCQIQIFFNINLKSNLALYTTASSILQSHYFFNHICSYLLLFQCQNSASIHKCLQYSHCQSIELFYPFCIYVCMCVFCFAIVVWSLAGSCHARNKLRSHTQRRIHYLWAISLMCSCMSNCSISLKTGHTEGGRVHTLQKQILWKLRGFLALCIPCNPNLMSSIF